MKVGILTLPIGGNVGGVLQAFALQEYLKRLGHDVILLDRRYNFDRPSIRKLARDIIQQIRLVYRKIRYGEIRSSKSFVRKYISKTRELLSEEDVMRVVFLNRLDAIIVGSDQVWNKGLLCYLDKGEFFLSFLKDSKTPQRLAYAASFGTELWEIGEDLQEYKAGIKAFKAVSVREKTGVRICKNQFQIDAVHVLDPTMLLTKEDYISIINENDKYPPPGTLLCYILNKTDKIDNAISVFAKRNGIKYYDYFRPRKEGVDVCQWLQAFYRTDMIITDSFHGCVFSILFNKPFVTFGNNERGQTRFDSLLEIMGLTDRQVRAIKPEIITETFQNKINWSNVNAKLDEWRMTSTQYLEENLH